MTPRRLDSGDVLVCQAVGWLIEANEGLHELENQGAVGIWQLAPSIEQYCVVGVLGGRHQEHPVCLLLALLPPR